ncbi:MAG: hypothetical protein IBJ03_11070 [Gemmatimonadaceae bacterium]|nr:hypothetical protein [Gemmatimonadaceae bacterium]
MDTTHLDAERLAAFDYEPFNEAELAHLAACAYCRAEQQAVASVVAMAHGVLSQETESAPRLVSWEQISAGLQRPDVAELAPTLPVQSLPQSSIRSSRFRSSQFIPRWASRAAAAAVLLATGATVGRLTGPAANGLSFASASQAAAAESLGLSRTNAVPVNYSDFQAAGGFGSVEEASNVLARAQRDYERASLWLAANDTTQQDSEVFRARLAALDQMMTASRAALRDAPQDPVINHYYLAAYTAREATLQQLMGTLPVDKTIERY